MESDKIKNSMSKVNILTTTNELKENLKPETEGNRDLAVLSNSNKMLLNEFSQNLNKKSPTSCTPVPSDTNLSKSTFVTEEASKVNSLETKDNNNTGESVTEYKYDLIENKHKRQNTIETEVNVINKIYHIGCQSMKFDTHSTQSANNFKNCLSNIININSVSEEVSLKSPLAKKYESKYLYPQETVRRFGHTPVKENILRSSVSAGPKTPPYFIHNIRGKVGGINSEILVYKLGSQSTPRKIRKNKHINNISRKVWGTPETNYFLRGCRSLQHNLVNKKVITKAFSSKRNIGLVSTELVKPVQITSFHKKKPVSKTMKQVHVNSQDLKSETDSVETFKIMPVKALVNQFEQLATGNKIRDTIEKKKITIKIPQWSKSMGRNNLSPENKINTESPARKPKCEQKLDEHINLNNPKNLKVNITKLGNHKMAESAVPGTRGDYENINITDSCTGNAQLSSSSEIINESNKIENPNELVNKEEMVVKPSIDFSNDQIDFKPDTTFDESSCTENCMSFGRKVFNLDIADSKQTKTNDEKHDVTSFKTDQENGTSFTSDQNRNMEDGIEDDNAFLEYFTIPEIKERNYPKYVEQDVIKAINKTCTETEGKSLNSTRDKELRYFIKVYEDEICNEVVSDFNITDTVNNVTINNDSNHQSGKLDPVNSNNRNEFCLKDEDFPPLPSPEKNTVFVD